MKSVQNKSVLLAVSIMIIGAFTRLIPHMPNFTAMEGISLFAGAYLGSRFLKFLAPIIVLYLTDFIINNTVSRSFFPDHEGLVFYDNYMLFNLIAMIVVVLIGSQFLKKVTAGRLALGVIGASLSFFVITNFGSWLTLPVYTKDLTGLLTSYIAAIPFFWTSLLSTFVFSIILFGSFELLSSRVFNKTETVPQ